MLGLPPSNRVMGAGQRRGPGHHARVDAVEPSHAVRFKKVEVVSLQVEALEV